MNLQLHRKQLILLGFSMILAVSAYWIPEPVVSAPPSVSQASAIESGADSAQESVLINGNWSQLPEGHRALI